MSEPHLTTEIVGYRQWRVSPELELRAAAHRDRTTWTLGINTAACGRRKADRSYFVGLSQLAAPPYSVDDPFRPDPCGDTPGEACECGFYGLHDPGDLWYGKQPRNALQAAMLGMVDLDPLLSGIILGWGKVQVHHQGFRSEFARAVAQIYDVPCVAAGVLPKIADEFGGAIPAALRPPRPERKDDTQQLMARLARFLAPPQSASALWAAFPTSKPEPALNPEAPKPALPAKQSNRQGPHQGTPRPPKRLGGNPRGAW